jgi:DNA-binding PadR family transcriptional regulator
MNMMSRSEEIILLTILQLESDAYGISIRDFIRKATGAEWSLAQIYDPLNRLARKGYVQKARGDPAPERGGRHKVLYTVTEEGKAALLSLRRMQDSIWAKIPEKGLK